MASIISTKTSGGGGIAVTGDTSGVLQLASNNGTTAVTIDASQNVGIGTANPVDTGGYGKALDTVGTNGSAMYVGQTSGTGARVLVGAYNNAGTTYGTVGTLSGGGYLQFLSTGTERMRIDTSGNLLFNSGYGSVATAYGCRAWVNFNGTGTVAIRASGNVTSITDRGTGLYTVNFTNAMPDTNYSFCGNTGDVNYGGVMSADSINSGVYTTTALAIMTTQNAAGAYFDAAIATIHIFR
jgi:hypothetical protein